MGLTATLGISSPLTRRRFPHANSPPDAARPQCMFSADRAAKLTAKTELSVDLRTFSPFRSTNFRLEITRQSGGSCPLLLPSPPCLSAPAARSPLSASMPEKHEMATTTARYGERRQARSTRRDHTRPDATVRQLAGLLTQQGTAKNVSGCPVTSLGRVLDSQNPQRVEISERASVARGAMQLLESREQTCWMWSADL